MSRRTFVITPDGRQTGRGCADRENSLSAKLCPWLPCAEQQYCTYFKEFRSPYNYNNEQVFRALGLIGENEKPFYWDAVRSVVLIVGVSKYYNAPGNHLPAADNDVNNLIRFSRPAF